MAKTATKAPPKPQQNLWRQKYGLEFEPVLDVNGVPRHPKPDVLIELYILRNYERIVEKMRNHRLLPWREHFKAFVSCIWGDPEGSFFFEWNPNADRILENFHKHRLLAVAGHASSGKTEGLACIAVAYWLIFPFETKILLTSLTAKSAKGKIWGSVVECWQRACQFFDGLAPLPGKLIASQNIIRYCDQGVFTDKAGLELVVGEASRAAESAEKIQGYKRGKVILMADELATLAPAILETALSNLKANEEFRMIGSFNPDSYFDPGGRFSKPKDGWHTINEHSSEWETLIEPIGLTGYCIRFDGETSPNVLAAKKLWRGLMSLEYLTELKNAYGPKTKSYWKMVRGYWSPTGSVDAIYSEAEIFNHRADASVTTWMEVPVMVAGLDPSYAHGGDRAALAIGKTGLAKSPDTGQVQRVFELTKVYCLDDDVTDKTRSKSEIIVSLLKQKLIEHKVHISNLAVDATGGGDPFSALIARECGSGFLQVQFGGSPSNKPVSKADKRPAKERFINMVSELWMVGIELIRTGQFKGLLPDVIAEMTARTFDDKAGRSGNLTAVEPKKKMKLRTQKSPDLSDGVFLALHVARMRHGLSSVETSHKPVGSKVSYGDPRLNAVMNPSWGQKKVLTLADDAAPVFAGGGWGE